MTIGEQIAETRASKGITVPELATILEIPKDRIYKWEQGKGNPKPPDSDKVSAWLSGTNSIKDAKQIETSNGAVSGIITRATGIDRTGRGAGLVEYYDVDFSAGEGSVTMLDSHRPSYEMDIPAFGGCVGFNVYGDSMESRLKSGSIVFGRKIAGWRDHLEYGQIYGIVMKDERRYLKYIRKATENSSKTHFMLRSENPKYDDFEIPQKLIHNIWLIEGWMLKTA